jgi:hypothetical protein
MRKLLCVLLFAALAIPAAELTGKWSGSFDITNSAGETSAQQAYMDLKEKAGEISGTAGPDADKQWPIQKGKLEGEKVSFEVKMDDGGVIVFALRFDGATLQGTAEGTSSEGAKLSAKVNLKRAS